MIKTSEGSILQFGYHWNLCYNYVLRLRIREAFFSVSGSTEFPLYRFYGQYILPEKVNIYAQKLPRLQIKEEIQMIRFVQDQSNRTLYNLNTARYSKIVPLFLPLDKPPSLESTEPTEKRWTALFISQ